MSEHIHHYSGGAWREQHGGLPCEAWIGIAVSPDTPDQWTVWNATRTYQTDDNGAHWHAVHGDDKRQPEATA